MSPTAINRRDALIGDQYQILPYAELPLTHQLAMAWYMAVDGEAWECEALGDMSIYDADFKSQFEALIPHFVEHYGTTMFGIVTITAQQAKDAYMQDPEIKGDFTTWEDYQKWYVKAHLPEYGRENRWPVILGDGEYEIFQDGHHRLHRYLLDDHPDVPVIFYPDRKHLEKLVMAQQRA